MNVPESLTLCINEYTNISIMDTKNVISMMGANILGFLSQGKERNGP